jgi:hypothetical protein
MKTLSLALLLMASVVFMLIGCSDNSAPVVPSGDQVLLAGSSPSALAKGSPVIHSASGNCGDYIDGGPVTFEFTANEWVDGCRGEWVANLHGQPKEWGKMHGKVMSLKVYDYSGSNAAVIGGVFTDKINEGWYFAFAAIDNGEGKEATPDQYTKWIFFTPSLEEAQAVWNEDPDGVVDAIVQMWADNGWVADPASIIVPIQNGNVQVK